MMKLSSILARRGIGMPRSDALIERFGCQASFGVKERESGPAQRQVPGTEGFNVMPSTVAPERPSVIMQRLYQSSS